MWLRRVTWLFQVRQPDAALSLWYRPTTSNRKSTYASIDDYGTMSKRMSEEVGLDPQGIYARINQ
jgi:hypothetical protein